MSRDFFDELDVQCCPSYLILRVLAPGPFFRTKFKALEPVGGAPSPATTKA